MPAKLWKTPYYNLTSRTNEDIRIDVTASVSAGLTPNASLLEFINFFHEKRIEKILDFGGGALRHTIPLLEEGFQVVVVEFDQQYERSKSKRQLEIAKEYPNFTKLVFPQDFRRDSYKYDLVLLLYVIQTMPIPSERNTLIRLLTQKMKSESYLLYMSRYGQVKDLPIDREISDGFFMNPTHKNKTFYRDFSAPETDEMFKKHKLKRIKTISKRGTDQIFLYSKGDNKWI